MRPVRVALAGATATSKWVATNFEQNPFGVGVAVTLGAAAVGLTYKVQRTYDDPGAERSIISATQTTTTITVTDKGDDGLGHGLKVGDYVNLKGLGSLMDGEYAVASVPSASTYTVTSVTSQTATAGPGARVTALRVVDDGTITGKTADFAALITQPVTALRLVITAVTTPDVTTMLVLQGSGSMN